MHLLTVLCHNADDDINLENNSERIQVKVGLQHQPPSPIYLPVSSHASSGLALQFVKHKSIYDLGTLLLGSIGWGLGFGLSPDPPFPVLE
jgi:hypothetical protein